jgi:hypothetical protein
MPVPFTRARFRREFELAECPACGSAFDDGQLFTRASDLSESDAEELRESATLERAGTRLKDFEVSNTAKAAVQTELETHQSRAIEVAGDNIDTRC